MNDTAYVFDADQNDFQNVLQQSTEALLLLDFWAPWCAPCKSLTPVLEKLAADYQGRVRVAKINTDENQEVANQVGVRSLPTVIFVRDGKLVHQFTGAQPESAVRQMIEALIGPAGEAEAEVAPEAPPQLTAAELDDALGEVEAKLADQPDDAGLLVRKADLLAQLRRSPEARQALELVPLDQRTSEEGRRAEALVELAEMADDGDEHELEAAARDAASAAMTRDYRMALDGFLNIMRRDRNFRDQLGRRGLVHTLTLANDPKLSGEYRRKMSTLLF